MGKEHYCRECWVKKKWLGNTACYILVEKKKSEKKGLLKPEKDQRITVGVSRATEGEFQDCWALQCAKAQVNRFFSPSALRSFWIYLFHLELSSLRLENHNSANGFYIASDQILPYSLCNLSCAETHKSIYGPLQLRPVHTFIPY